MNACHGTFQPAALKTTICHNKPPIFTLLVTLTQQPADLDSLFRFVLVIFSSLY